MRTAIGLLALGIAGGVVPVGVSVVPILTPLLTGTVAAFLVLVALCLVTSFRRLRSPRRFESPASRPAVRSGGPVRAAARRTT